MLGVHRAQRAQLNAVADGRESTAEFVTLGTADGMANPETNGGENQPAGWKARDGRLWFPTVQGVVVIDPKAVPLNEPPPSVVMEQVKADEEVVYGEESRVSGLESKAHRQESQVQSSASKVEQRVSRRARKSGTDERLLTSAATGIRIAPGRGR